MSLGGKADATTATITAVDFTKKSNGSLPLPGVSDDNNPVRKVSASDPDNSCVGSCQLCLGKAQICSLFQRAQEVKESNLEDDIPRSVRELLERTCQVEPWHEEDFVLSSRLHDAVRNKGSVNLMKRISHGDFVAVKQMPTQWVTGSYREFRRKHPGSTERPWVDFAIVKHLNNLDASYVCELYGIFADATHTYVVSSFATEGDLFKWQCDNDIELGPEREATMRPVVAQMLSAIRWIHDLGISHRDITLENVVLDKGKVKLIDFGMATFSRFCTSICGKRSYQAPEMHEGLHDAYLSDAFAAGVVAFAMAVQDYPWQATTPTNKCKLFTFVEKFGLRSFLGKRKERQSRTRMLIEVLSEDFIAFLEGLFAFNPQDRLTLGEHCYQSEQRGSVWEQPWLMQASS